MEHIDFMKKTLVLLAFLAVSSLCFAQRDTIRTTEPYKTESGDIIYQPEFKGGIEKMYEYISHNFIYPDEAEKRSVSGKIEVEFTVEKSGDITGVGVLKGLDYSIDEEVVNLIKGMPRWYPATKNGIPVRYKVSMPINIKASRTRSQRSSTGLKDYRE